MKKKVFRWRRRVSSCSLRSASPTAELWIGAAEADITPDRLVSLTGQFHVRVADPKQILSRCKANVLAIEARENGQAADCAMVIACDVCYVPRDTQQRLRAYLGDRLKGFDTGKLFLTATHTHTGPALDQGWYDDLGNAMPPEEYVAFFFERVAAAAVKAWEGRARGSAAWGLGHAVTSQNRRSAYADGSSVMYGTTDKPEFLGLEGGEDHAVDIVFFLDEKRRPVATVMAVACPAQVDEGLSRVHADYWGDVRDVRQRFGRLAVLGLWTGGDQPARHFAKSAEGAYGALRRLNRKLAARRLIGVYESTWEAVQSELRGCVRALRGRFRSARQEYHRSRRRPPRLHCIFGRQRKLVGGEPARKNWYKKTVERYEGQSKGARRCAVEMP